MSSNKWLYTEARERKTTQGINYVNTVHRQPSAEVNFANHKLYVIQHDIYHHHCFVCVRVLLSKPTMCFQE